MAGSDRITHAGGRARRGLPGAALGIAAAALALGIAPRAGHAQELADYDYENLAFRGIGADVGRIWPSNLDPATTYRIRVDLGYLGPGVRIVPSIGYWKTRVEDSEIEAFENQLEEVAGTDIELSEIEMSDLTLQLDAHFVWTTPIDVLMYIGAGAGLHLLNGQGEDIDDTFIEDLFDSIMPGVSAIAGVEYAILDRVRFYGEGHFSIVSDILNPGVRAGVAVMFPVPIQGGD